MINIASAAKFVPTAIAAAVIGLGALMTVGVPSAHASERSDCESKGGTFTETEVTWNGTTGTRYSCCVKDATTNTTTCTSTTVTKNIRIPVTVRSGVIDTVENIEPAENVEPAPPIRHVPLDVLNADAQIQPAP
jgi:hypothetical protein